MSVKDGFDMKIDADVKSWQKIVGILITAILLIALSWGVVTGVYLFETLCFDLQFSALKATGIWVAAVCLWFFLGSIKHDE